MSAKKNDKSTRSALIGSGIAEFLGCLDLTMPIALVGVVMGTLGTIFLRAHQ